MPPLREYNGDKLIVTFDAEEGPLALQVAYMLARARVLMARGDGEGIDGAAVTDTVDRTLEALEEVRRVRQQLTAAKTSIDNAAEIVGKMGDSVRGHLDRDRVAGRRGGAAGVSGAPVARRVVVHGRVQGVFFRESARRRAEQRRRRGLDANRARRHGRGAGSRARPADVARARGLRAPRAARAQWTRRGVRRTPSAASR